LDFWYYFWSALGLGALHALEPGHGKSIMGTYLILSRGRPVDAVLLGLTSAVTHTLVIMVMAVLAHSATALAMSHAPLSRDRLEIWLQLVSGAVILLVGLRMLLRKSTSCSCCCGQSHPHKFSVKGVKQFRGNLPDVLLLGITNGLLPCPSALAVLLLAVSSGALASGLALVFAFGLGGAIALVGVGLLFVKIASLAGGLFSNRSWGYLARVSGALICGIGGVTVYGALLKLS